MGRLFTFAVIFFLSSKVAVAQENIIEHPIKRGESVYVISKKYGVSMNAIFILNPGSENIIYAGRTLKVPVPNSTTSDTTITEDRITNYEVKRGETKSGLSRRFGVSIAMLEQQNPHIIRMLQAGHIINIDKSIEEVEPTVNEGEHRVVKGETLWGISRRYDIRLQQLIAANEDQLLEFLQIGKVLIIPDKNTIVENSGEYLVKRGDTKFELSRRFNMTIAELEEKNPHIIDMLMAGHIIDITKTIEEDSSEDTVAEIDSSKVDTDQSTTEENTTVDELDPTETETQPNDSVSNEEGTKTKYVDYVIKPKETLFSLSRKAGMTIDELTSLNPKLLTAVNAGDVIKMPLEVVDNPTAINENDVTDTEEANNNPSIGTNENNVLYTNLDITKTSGLYFYTPFSSDELRSAELRENMVNGNADYQKFIDFFQGAQIAIDSAKVLGLNFEITLIKNNNLRQQLDIESPYQDNALLVPFLENSANYPDVTSNQAISVIDIESQIDSISSNTLFKSIPSKEIQKKKVLDYIANQDAQVLVVTDLEEARNKDLIETLIPNPKFLSVDKAGFFKNNELLQLTLNRNKLNYVILDSEKTIVFLNTTTTLMNKLADYDIQLVLMESSLIPKQNEVSNMRYRILKLIFPAIINPEDHKQETDFEITYQDLYETKPTKSAILGFNITLDVLLRLSQKTSFESTIDSIVSEHSHLKFDYQKTSDKIYSNTSLYLMQYDSDDGIIVLKNR